MPVPDQSKPLQNISATGLQPHLSIDITSQRCPMTFVRTRLALDRLQSGEILSVRLTGEEPRANVPRSAVELGHQILHTQEKTDGSQLLFILKS